MESVRQRPLDLRTRRTAAQLAAITSAAVAVAVAGLLFVTVAQAGEGASPPSKSLRPLLRDYPLDPGAGRVKGGAARATSVAPARRRADTSRPSSDGARSSTLRTSAIVGGAALLAAIVALLVIQSRRASPLTAEGAQMAGFIRRNRSRTSEDTPPDGVEAPAADASPVVETPNAGSGAGSDRLAEPVAAVLQAADEAAARLTEATRREAEEIRRQAEVEASARIEEARQEAESLRAAAEDARAEAVASGKQTRAAAEAYAEERRLAAEREATQIVAQAEGEAVSRRDALIKHSALLEKDAALAENRLRLLVGGLREVADRLDDLVGRATPESAQAEGAEQDEEREAGAIEGDARDPTGASPAKTRQRSPARAGMS
jgi:hypothetical protein